MSIEEDKELARSSFEEFDTCRGNLANLHVWLVKYCAPEFIFHHLSGTDYTGEQMIQMTCEGLAAFPDFHSVIYDTVAEVDKVVVCYTSHGSQKGPYLGVAPTGNYFVTKGVDIYRIMGSKIVEKWNFQDDLGGLIQLGFISFVPYDESRDNKLVLAKPFGVIVYTPLMMKLEVINDVDERRQIAIRYLPVSLLCASQNDQCLKDVKNVSEAFPDLLPIIFTCATELRSDKRFGDWTKYESTNYKDFISSIVNPKP
jgi:predicted ester cyclase